MKCPPILTLLLAWPVTAAAVDFSQVDLQPYLTVSSKQIYGTIIPPTEHTTEDQQRFISRGGAVLSTLVLRDENGTSVTQIYRAVAMPLQIAALRSELNALRIRGQRSCELASETIVGRYDFTWYAPRGQRNSFAIVQAKAGSSGLPPCRPAAQDLIAAVIDFETVILENPDTEVLTSP